MSTLNGRSLFSVEVHTASDTLTASESGTWHTNQGASGAITFTLPAATVGLRFGFCVQTAQELRIDPNGSETISATATGVPGAAGKYLTADAVQELVEIACIKAGSWAVLRAVGTWTHEA